MAPTKILLTGATGYIGGSILSLLLKPSSGIAPSHSISVLIRGEEKVPTFKDLGVTPILFQSLDESELLRKVASEHDIVIHTAQGYHVSSAKSLVLGLGDRVAATGAKVHYLHTTGTSNIGDQPITGAYSESHIFSDTEDIYAYEKKREAIQPYLQRTTDIVAIETGLAVQVPTTLIMSPTIFGIGSGHFNKLSLQVPNLMRIAFATGKAQMIGNGEGVWDFVHISDVVELYLIVLKRVLGGEDVPVGEKGILFSANGRFRWKDVASGIADALVEVGALKTKEIASVTIEEAGQWMGGDIVAAELGFASNSKTVSDVSFGLGWKPLKTEADFKASFLEEAKLVVKNSTPS
ncbi:NAD(P)-binding protein [Cadophora sp. DSE1049]|nr:NAD(P)-binding protein [Cadophora sp. DSE1049]